MHKDYTPKDAMNLIKQKGIQFIDLRFMDFPGLQQHMTVPVSVFKEEVFEEGQGFDGSSIRGWQAINESDMLVLPDPRTRKRRLTGASSPQTAPGDKAFLHRP